ncbi:T9SS type A sorting domain-containing protein [Pontibacter pamirensis]|uniref:T9SS type A sorting domain-containing protein n=1 Tax=Pontibacter pamirensis TaxID=2562824 RepID=UPI001389CC0E|nr:T9SS type A sorting domain-containing protein [Pontibacter pamirensis]
MRIFTKIALVVTLISSHLLSFAGTAVINNKGVDPIKKGTGVVWKLMPASGGGELVVSANNSRPAFVINPEKHTCSKIYASAVSQVFHTVEAKADKAVYTNITLAAIAPGKEIKPVPSINAYPNPSRGNVTLALNLPGNNTYKIRISNTIGRVIRVHELGPAEKMDLALDLSSYPSGVYFYSLLVNDKTVETKRLVLQK